VSESYVISKNNISSKFHHFIHMCMYVYVYI
jgi:hypothetical protein